jgi:hypothetical protein
MRLGPFKPAVTMKEIYPFGTLQNVRLSSILDCSPEVQYEAQYTASTQYTASLDQSQDVQWNIPIETLRLKN